MSEPGAGSDLASLSTRAELRGDRFVVNGQKVWTSYATVAEKCFCYVRTTPLSEAPKHKGISVLIIDMDTPGIEVRPLRHITGAAEFAEVFFTDVEVPATNLVGRLNDGWRITMASLGHERGGLWVQGVATCEHALGDLVALARKLGLDADPTVRRRLGAAYAQVRSLRALGYKGFASFARGSAAPEHSLLKLATSETGKALFELGMDLLGPYGVVVDPERGEQAGRWPRSFFVSFASTIAGGTSEIQRNIIAERVLGLPRG
jgi:alkylation response protein AidB-like acyl-CoA dehydrogenase